MVGLGLTRLEPLRTYASSSVGNVAGGGEIGGPSTGPFSIDSLRARAVDAARFAGDDALGDELSDVCCWAPAATAIRKRPLDVQNRGAEYFFRDFPGGDQLAEILHYTNNTSWHTPKFRFDPDTLVDQHYSQLQRAQSGIRTEVLTPDRLSDLDSAARLDIMLDRSTGERLASAADRSEPMWAALSVFSGMMLDPTDELSRRLTPLLSLRKAAHRSLARTATVGYSQIIIGAIQRAVWSDLLGGLNPTLPLVQLSAAGFLPLGERNGRFLLLQPATSGARLTGYPSGNI